MDVDLSGIHRTLLMPLWGRAKATRQGSRILADPKAVEIVDRLGLGLEGFDRVLHPSNELFTIARARAVDDIVRKFAAAHRRPVIVNLGAGLDTAFHRIGDGGLQWLDVDLPPVIELRRTLIPEGPRNRCAAGSILHTDWVREVPPGSRPVLFVASGVLAYLHSSDIRRLLSLLTRNFPGAEMVLDVQSPLTNFFGNRRLTAAGMGEARFRWGAFSGRAIAALFPGVAVLESFPVFSRLSPDDYPDQAALRLARTMDALRTMTIVHMRLPPSGALGDRPESV